MPDHNLTAFASMSSKASTALAARVASSSERTSADAQLLFQLAKALTAEGDHIAALRAVREAISAAATLSVDASAAVVVVPSSLPDRCTLWDILSETVVHAFADQGSALEAEATQRCLLAAALCIDHLAQTADGIEFARDAVHHVQLLRARQSHSDVVDKLDAFAQFSFGVACGKRAYEVATYSQRQKLSNAALTSLERAIHLHPSSPHFNLQSAAVHADLLKISAANRSCQRALELDSALGDGWLLLALLLSCGRQLPEAGHACLGGLAECPEHVELLLMQLKLASERNQQQEALEIIQKVADAAGLENFVDGLPQFTVQKSSVESSSALHSRLNSHRVKVLLSIAEAYLASKSNTDGPNNMLHYALLCVQLAQTLAPIGSLGAADCRVALGCIDELHDRSELARAHYEAALSISSSHVGAHVRLAKLMLSQSDTQSAHAHLKSATRTNAAVPEVWLLYARALRATPGARHGVDATASEALLTALELERASPLLSFANVARTIGA